MSDRTLNTAPTAPVGTSDSQIANTAFVTRAVANGPTGGAGIAEAPANSLTYGRNNATWVRSVAVAGDTMTGPLVLAADPTVALGAATKEYVDAAETAAKAYTDAIPVFGPSGPSHAKGEVPDPGAGGTAVRFLREDTQWVVPPMGVPGGAPGQVQYNNSGAFGGLTNVQLTAQINPFSATSPGIVPASGGSTALFLRADGNWIAPPTGGAASSIGVGSTAILGGTGGNFLFDNVGMVGEFTPAQATAALNVFTPGRNGLVSASGGGTVNFLRADGTWAPPTGGGGTPGGASGTIQYNNGGAFNGFTMTGDATISISGTTGTISVQWGNAPVFGPSGPPHAKGLVPDPGAAMGSTRYLREDASWQAPTVVSDTPPTTPASGTLWWQSNSGAFWISYTDVNSTQWVQINGQTGLADAPSDSTTYGRSNATWVNVLPLAGGTLTGPLILAADPTTALGAATKEYVDANALGPAPSDGSAYGRISGAWAPVAQVDALAYNGMQINGSMDVSQELGTTAIAVGGIAIDGWRYLVGGAPGTNTVGQTTDAPPGFAHSLILTATVANTGGSASYAQMFQNIEGYRISRLAWGTASAQPLSIAFWAKANVTGTFGVTVTNGANASRTYAVTFVISAANTWQWVTVQIPGDTVGPWAADNTSALTVHFCPQCGVSNHTAPNVWTAGNFVGSTGISNNLTTIGNTFQITGVLLLPGTVLPSAARSAYVMRPFDQELTICRRYYQKSYDYATVPGSANTLPGAILDFQAGLVSALNNVWRHVQLAPFMRADPTVTIYSSNSGAAGKAWDGNNSLDVTCGTQWQGMSGFNWTAQSGAAATGTNFQLHWVADARI